MFANFSSFIDRAALAVFLVAAAVPVFSFPLLAMTGIH